MNGNFGYLVATLGVAFFSTQLLHAGDDMKSVQSTVETAPANGPYDYHVHADVRTENGIGLGVGVYGGAVGFQNGDLRFTSSAIPGEVHADTQSRAGATAGIRVTNVWPTISAIAGGERTGELGVVLPAMAFDVFWTGYNYKGNTSSGTSLTSNLNTVSFEYVPELKFNLGPVRPYIGIGIGGTYVNSGDIKINGSSSNGSGDDFDFSAEGLAGVEFFIDPRWALSLEYKYLYIVSPDIDAGPVDYHLDGLGAHYITAGLNYYF